MVDVTRGSGDSTLDDMVEELTLQTPSGMELNLDRQHPWFSFAKAGLGYLGAVTSLVLRTMPRYEAYPIPG